MIHDVLLVQPAARRSTFRAYVGRIAPQTVLLAWHQIGLGTFWNRFRDWLAHFQGIHGDAVLRRGFSTGAACETRRQGLWPERLCGIVSTAFLYLLKQGRARAGRIERGLNGRQLKSVGVSVVAAILRRCATDFQAHVQQSSTEQGTKGLLHE
ncbi:hypothetical protein ACFV8E_35430 [Streptomyces sp. NPDC059849]|uniref:hypothetical protein n=1 Tax=Streptomyces sp. NPDC059849 TaxID=3346969 RepID=UPI00366A3EBA